MRKLWLIPAMLLSCATAQAFDLQGHRGARGLAPENTIAGFETALKTGVNTLELDLGLTKDGIVVVSHDTRLNPDITRGADGAFLQAPGPAIHALTFAELQRYDVGRIKPGSAYAERFVQQRPADGARIPALTQVFDLVRRMGGGDIRFNVETKLTPSSGGDTPDPEIFAKAVAQAIVTAGMTARAAVQSFDWRTLAAMRAIAPDIARVCLTIEAPGEDNMQRGRPGPSPWTAGLDIDDFGGSAPKLAAAAGCSVWSPYVRNLTAAAMTEAAAAGLKVIPWTVNEPADMAASIRLGVDGIITDYPDRLRAVLSQSGQSLPPPLPDIPPRD